MTDTIESIFPTWRGKAALEPYLLRATDALHEKLNKSEQSITYRNWHEEFERLQSLQNPILGYSYYSPDLFKHVNSISNKALPYALLGLLIWHMNRFLINPERYPAPNEFYIHVNDSMIRICEAICNDEILPDLKNDSFSKDLGIVRGALLPAMAQLIYPASGIMRTVVMRNGLASAWYMYNNCGSLKPFMEIHTHDAMAKNYFNKSGWDETYRLASYLLDYLPNSRGLFGSSWFYDPIVPKISPRLSYLQDIPLSQGARLFRIGTSIADVNLATLTSDTRRNLYLSGQYLPTKYALVWPRKLLASYFQKDLI